MYARGEKNTHPSWAASAILLDGDPLGKVDKFRFLSQSREVGLTFPDPHSLACLLPLVAAWNIVGKSIALYGCKRWPAWSTDERMLAVFDNESIRQILHVSHIDCVRTVEQRRRLYLACILAQLDQRRLRWLGQAARHPKDELNRGLFLSTQPRTWHDHVGDKLKEDLEPLSWQNPRWGRSGRSCMGYLYLCPPQMGAFRSTGMAK